MAFLAEDLEFSNDDGTTWQSFADFNATIVGLQSFGIPPVSNQAARNPVRGEMYRSTRVLQRVLAVTLQFVASPGTTPENQMTDEQAGIRDLLAAIVDTSLLLRFDSRTLTCRYAGGLEGQTPDNRPERGVARLLAWDPMWYGVETSPQDVIATPVVSNAGTAPAQPIFVLSYSTGVASVTSIANSTSGDTITFNGLTMIAGEKITLDFKRQSFKSNYRDNIIRFVQPGSDLGSFRLLPGNNTLSLTVGAGVGITATWQPRYWGID